MEKERLDEVKRLIQENSESNSIQSELSVISVCSCCSTKNGG